MNQDYDEKYIVCVNYGYEGWGLEVFSEEKKAVEAIKSTCTSDYRIFLGKELEVSFKESVEVREKSRGR